MSNDTTVVVLRDTICHDDNSVMTTVHSVMTRPREQALRRAMSFIIPQKGEMMEMPFSLYGRETEPVSGGGVTVRYRVEVHSADGYCILKYQ
jgi:hypothetical protein